MEKVILIKYGELTTKGDNRKEFIRILANNILEKINSFDAKIIKEHSRMYIVCDKSNEDQILDVLKHTFGIHKYNVAYKVDTDVEIIKNSVLELLKEIDFKSFKVNAKRRDKSFEISSMDFNRVIGGHVLQNVDDIKVDVHNPDIFINIEINKEDTYIYFNDVQALGGYPVGVQKKGLLMLSGGIDSPVAGYQALKRGVKIDAIYFEALPHTSLAAREKVISLGKELLKYSSDFNLFVIPFTEIEEAIYKEIDNTYMITILRRMMYRISERIAKENDSLILINGESIGQVASQTLTSMVVINDVTNMPVIRPLACMDKLEIIKIAKNINTYETSIIPFEDCCTIFVPKHPVINPKLFKAIQFEELIDYEQMIDKAINDTLKIRITNKNEFEDLL